MPFRTQNLCAVRSLYFKDDLLAIFISSVSSKEDAHIVRVWMLAARRKCMRSVRKRLETWKGGIIVQSCVQLFVSTAFSLLS